MPVLQRDLERLVANTRAIDALTVADHDRLDNFIQLRVELEEAWDVFYQHNLDREVWKLSGFEELKATIEKVVEG